jgi:site-specific recombinase XerD
MSQKTRDDLLPLVQSFFQSYLRNMRGASHHTIRSYRDAVRLFFLFLVRRGRRSIADLRLDDIQAEAVLTFLDHGESCRGNSPATRNCRLAAIRSFAQHLLRHDVAR